MFATRPSCAWGGKRWRREIRPSLIGAAGRSRFPAPLVAGLAERGGRAPTPPLYNEGEGGMAHRTLMSPISSCFCFFLSLIMEKGNPGPSMVAARVAARQRAPPPPRPAVVEPDARGRGRGRGHGRGRGRGHGARGRGGRGGAPALPPPTLPFLTEGHVGDQPDEFFIWLRRPPRRCLRLPAPFAREMEPDPPQSLRLHMRGCGNGGTRVNIDFSAPRVMYLRRGWMTFARIHSLTAGLVLYFKLMEDGLLSVKVFGGFGTRLKCYMESSSDNEDSSSSGSDEEGSNNDDESVERGHVDLVSD